MPKSKATSTRRKAAAAKPAAKPEKKHKKEPKAEVKAKEKVVRGSFTMPQDDFALIGTLKQKALKSGVHVKKSELLRAGLQALAKLNVTQFKSAVASLERIKTGRPPKS